MTSGSSLRMDLRPEAKVMPAWLLTWIWLISLKRYSAGSSTVIILRPILSSELTEP